MLLGVETWIVEVSMGRKTLRTMSDNVRAEHYYLLTENVNFRKREEESQETQAN